MSATTPSTATVLDRVQAHDRYRCVRTLSEQLCEPLAIEDYSLQTIPEASPPKWHLAHVSWFFETFLLTPELPDYAAFHPRFDYLFNSYYEQTGTGFWPRTQRGLLSRPTVAEIYAYRQHVDAAMERLIRDCPQECWADVATRLAIGLNHEQQHQELLLTDIKHHLGYNPLYPAYRAELLTERQGLATDALPLEWLEFEGGMTRVGASGEDSFTYDNEHPAHQQWLAPFQLANRLITNGEYLEFVADGAYDQVALWLSDAWATIQREHWQAPLYWHQIDGVWHEMTLGGLEPLHPATPVTHISYYEADAFARWAGKRLPTEAEWEHVALQQPVRGHFVDDGFLHPRPASGSGLQQLFGDCWEWTGSAYLAHPGYRAPAGAIGEYNGKFMCNQMVLKGGSCASSRDHLRASYRNFFYPHERWQFTGIRLAEGRA